MLCLVVRPQAQLKMLEHVTACTKGDRWLSVKREGRRDFNVENTFVDLKNHPHVRLGIKLFDSQKQGAFPHF